MKRFCLAISVTCWCICSGVGRSEFIDFDNLPGGGQLAPGTVLTDQYESLGVTFSAFENQVPVDSLVLLNETQTGNTWQNQNFAVFSPLDLLRISFQTPVENVRWLTEYPLGDPFAVTFSAFDTGGMVLGSLNGPALDEGEFLFAGISRIDILASGEETFWGMDDLEFDVTAIPEPSTCCLSGIAAAFLLAVQRKRRKRRREHDQIPLQR